MEMWKSTEQTHPVSNDKSPSSHVIALSLEDVKEQSDAVLRGGDQLPDAVLAWGVLSGPTRAGDWAVQLGDEASAGGWTQHNKGRGKDMWDSTKKCFNLTPKI